MANVCLVGHGMMGVWHSEALQKHSDATLHTVVGRAAAPDAARRRLRQAASRRRPRSSPSAFGYRKWTTDLGEALADPEVDVVIIAGPSETHADMALAAIEAGKHTLVEIPIAMNLDGRRAGRGRRPRARSHPRRGAPDAVPPGTRRRSSSASAAARSGSATCRAGSSSTACRTSARPGCSAAGPTTCLWHHTTHLVDFGLWMLSGGDLATVEKRIQAVSQLLPAARASAPASPWSWSSPSRPTTTRRS